MKIKTSLIYIFLLFVLSNCKENKERNSKIDDSNSVFNLTIKDKIKDFIFYVEENEESFPDDKILYRLSFF